MTKTQHKQPELRLYKTNANKLNQKQTQMQTT